MLCSGHTWNIMLTPDREHHADPRQGTPCWPQTGNTMLTPDREHHADPNQGCILDIGEASCWTQQKLCIRHTGDTISYRPQSELCIWHRRSLILTTLRAGSGPGTGRGFIRITSCTSHIANSCLVVTHWTGGTVCVVHRILTSWTLVCNDTQCS